MRQIKKQAPVFVAILFLFVIALGIGGLHPVEPALLPARPGCRCSGTDFYTVKAELPTGQAVVPGQGQTVNIAGVKVGEVGDGAARGRQAPWSSMKIKDKYKPIYRDATVLLRPKTGLKDMYLALDPGNDERRRAPRGRARAGGEHAART